MTTVRTGRIERSVSVGDVVQVIDKDAATVDFYAVGNVGWQYASRLQVIKALRRQGVSLGEARWLVKGEDI